MNPFAKSQNHLLTNFFGQNKVYTITDMTPQEKAAELILTYMAIVVKQDLAKQCALKAVDKIKETLKEVCDEEILGIHMIYWSKVQQEIEKL